MSRVLKGPSFMQENTQQPEVQNLTISQKRPAEQNYDEPATTTRPVSFRYLKGLMRDHQ
jgi:hypothetical protein